MIYSVALSLLLGSELTYYLLIVQTGVVSHFHSDLITLFPMFVGGVMGTWLSGFSWFGSRPNQRARRSAPWPGNCGRASVPRGAPRAWRRVGGQLQRRLRRRARF